MSQSSPHIHVVPTNPATCKLDGQCICLSLKHFAKSRCSNCVPAPLTLVNNTQDNSCGKYGLQISSDVVVYYSESNAGLVTPDGAFDLGCSTCMLRYVTLYPFAPEMLDVFSILSSDCRLVVECDGILLNKTV